MRIEHLSRAADAFYRTAQDRERRAVDAVARADAEVAAARRRLDDATRRKPTWKRALRVPTEADTEARRALHEARVGRRAAGAERLAALHEGQRQGAGDRGRHEVVAHLARSLDDRWIAFVGYRNGAGEVDLVVCGPSGVWLVEAKSRNAQLQAAGSNWRLEKLDRWGNVVRTTSAVDRRGRPWARQIRRIADGLRRWLRRNGVRTPVRTAVLLVHPRASLGMVSDPGVDHLSVDPRDLAARLEAGRPVLSREQRDEVERLLRRDHRYHARRRSCR